MILRSIPRKRRMAAYTGRVMIDTVRGVLRVRKWPKKRGKTKSARQQKWIDWFIQANQLAKYVDGMSAARAIEISLKSGMYPRDVLLMAMRGRLYTWVGDDGWKWFSVAARQDISDTLDILAQTVGDILVRAVDRWKPPVPGNVNDVLTLKGSPAIPEWQPAAGGGVSFGGALATKLGNQSIPNATWTAIIFDAEQYDSDGLHDNAVNPSRMTVPAGWTKVRLTAGTKWTSNNTGERIMRFKMNGAQFPGDAWQRNLSRANSQNSTASPAIAVVEDDYFEFEVYHTRGAAINIEAPADNVYFAMERAQ